jgi:hypothetical protein
MPKKNVMVFRINLVVLITSNVWLVDDVYPLSFSKVKIGFFDETKYILT